MRYIKSPAGKLLLTPIVSASDPVYSNLDYLYITDELLANSKSISELSHNITILKNKKLYIFKDNDKSYAVTVDHPEAIKVDLDKSYFIDINLKEFDENTSAKDYFLITTFNDITRNILKDKSSKESCYRSHKNNNTTIARFIASLYNEKLNHKIDTFVDVNQNYLYFYQDDFGMLILAIEKMTEDEGKDVINIFNTIMTGLDDKKSNKTSKDYTDYTDYLIQTILDSEIIL